MNFRWTKQKAGYYTLDGTDLAVASANATNADCEYLAATEWALVERANPEDHLSGENVNWYDTMREARAAAERLAESR